jgi:TM2 domain-containing membrane protein YozV
MSIKSLFIAICFFFLQNTGFGSQTLEQTYYLVNANLEIIDSVTTSDLNLVSENKSRPNPLLNLFKTRQKTNKRITAAVLAFPFPFGIVGLHRIYLGTAPYVPVVYIASLGGIFGVLPFIDFCILILDKDEKRYVENKKVFMWIN